MSNKHTIIVVEDENSILNILEMVFKSSGYQVYTAKNGKEALMMISSYCPDLILLDLGLPDMDGLKIIQSVRSWSSIPIIVVSARNHEKDKVTALDLGADDYLTKPFGTAELLARVRTALRHASGDNDKNKAYEGTFKVGALTIDYDKRQVFKNGENVHLTQNEYKIVALLSKYSGKVLTYDFMMKQIWGPNIGSDNRILRVNMANIRRKIETQPADPAYIFTEIGVGYRMAEEKG